MSSFRTIHCLILSLLVFGCSDSIEVQGEIPEDLFTLAVTAISDGNGSAASKTVLNADLCVEWQENDALSVFDGGGNRKFTTSENGSKVTFSGRTLKNAKKRYALYPYDENASCDVENGLIRTSVPARQTAVKGSFGTACNLAAGKLSDSNGFTARNIGGIIRFSLMRNDIAAVTFTSKRSTDALAGEIEISFDNDGIPHSTAVNCTNSVTLMPASGCFEPGTYYISVLSADMEEGYSVRIINKDGLSHTIESTDLTSIARSRYIDIYQLDKLLDWGISTIDILFYDSSTNSLVQPFTTDIPTSSSKTETTYTLKGTSYKFTIGSNVGYGLRFTESYNGLSLNIGSSGLGWIKLPPVEGKELRAVTLYSGTTMSNTKTYHVVSDKNDLSYPLSTVNLNSKTSPTGVIAAAVNGEEEKFYYICVDPESKANGVIARITLTYKEDNVGRDFPPYDVEVRENSNTPWRMFQATTVDAIPGFNPGQDPQTDQYGGWICGWQFPATGHFYVTQDSSGRWWIADPLGNPYISKGLCGFRLDLDSESAIKAFQDKYDGDKKKWGPAETEWIRSKGFNSYGAFSSDNGYKYSDMPYIVHVSPMSSYINKNYGGEYPDDGIPPVFDAGFPSAAENILDDVALYNYDKRALGIITDNEIPWRNDLLKKCLAAASTTAHNKAAVQWLTDNGYTTNDIGTVDVQQKFAAFCLEKYLKIITDILKEYAPKLPYYGCKFSANKHELINPYAFEVSGRYMDAISIDYYHHWAPTQEQLLEWYSWAKKPVMFAEWYIKGMDSGMPNKSGVGWEVKTQKDRGYYYQTNCIALLKSGVSVGWQWFRYMDNNPEAVHDDNLSNIDANKGVVNVRMEQYTDFLDVMQQLNDNTYNLCMFYSK